MNDDDKVKGKVREGGVKKASRIRAAAYTRNRVEKEDEEGAWAKGELAIHVHRARAAPKGLLYARRVASSVKDYQRHGRGEQSETELWGEEKERARFFVPA